MRTYLSIIATALAALTGSAALAADDIAGVTLGSSLAEAKAAIAKANPNYQLTPLTLRSGKEAGVTAVTTDQMPATNSRNTGGPSDEFAALQTDSGKVWFMARVQRLQDGARIKSDALAASVTEKFGKPSHGLPMDFGFVWQFDRDGKQYVGEEHAGPCARMLGSSSNLPGVSVGAPQEFSATCGKIFAVESSLPTDGMLPYYIITMIDVKSMYDELTARDAKAEAERQKKLSDEQAKGVKPNL